MRITVTIFFICAFSYITKAQTTAIPDSTFEYYLISRGLDTLPTDGHIQTSHIDTLTKIDLQFNNGVSNLTGIEEFTLLKELWIQANQITTLDLTQNSQLEILECINNPLTGIDLSGNPILKKLYIAANPFTSIDLSQNPLLDYLLVVSSELTILDLSNNSMLTDIFCESNNLLTCLNLRNGNNINMAYQSFYNNPLLTCIEVDDSTYSANNWTEIDPGVTFSENCYNICSSLITDITEKTITKSVSIFPNPTTESINIELGETLSNVKTTLTNSLGQVVIRKEFTTTDFISLDIDVPKGIYFLQLQTENREIITKKIVME